MKQYELIQEIIVDYRMGNIDGLQATYNYYGKQSSGYPKDPYNERRILMTFVHYMLDDLRETEMKGKHHLEEPLLERRE